MSVAYTLALLNTACAAINAEWGSRGIATFCAIFAVKLFVEAGRKP